MALPVGSSAPDFTLRRRIGGAFEDVTLSSRFGSRNTVLLFFPAAFTGPCTEELCSVSSGLAAWSDFDADVFGVSADAAFAQEAWAKKENIEFPLLSDYKREVIAAYDVVWPDLAGMGPSAARAVFVIDKQGVIRYVEQTENPGVLPNLEAAKAALSQLV